MRSTMLASVNMPLLFTWPVDIYLLLYSRAQESGQECLLKRPVLWRKSETKSGYKIVIRWSKPWALQCPLNDCFRLFFSLSWTYSLISFKNTVNISKKDRHSSHFSASMFNDVRISIKRLLCNVLEYTGILIYLMIWIIKFHVFAEGNVFSEEHAIEYSQNLGIIITIIVPY